MKLTTACLLGAACLSLAAGYLVGQQPATPPAAPRPPVIPFTTAEIEAIPLTPPHQGKSITRNLFDGKTLDGWQGNMEWWSAKDGEIVAKATEKVPTNFLYTKDTYSDFRLTLASRVVESENHAGVAFWGEIAEQGANKWYTRGPLVIFPIPSMWDYLEAKGLRVLKVTSEKVTSQHDWVQVEILAQGNRVRTAMNGVEVMEWREPDPNRIKVGPLGIQLHALASAQEVHYKDIVVETFPKESRLLTVKK